MPWIALGYPLLAHLGVWLHDRRLQCLALIWLLIVSMWRALCQRRAWAWITLAVGTTLLCVVSFYGAGIYALYIPPVMIPLALLLLFATSLRRGATPLVSQFAEALRGEPLPPVLQAYTRNVTRVWCGVSSALALSAIATAIWTRPEIWSLITNVIHYLVLGAVFLIEFIYRRLRYGRLEPWSFVEYLRRLAHLKLIR